MQSSTKLYDHESDWDPLGLQGLEGHSRVPRTCTPAPLSPVGPPQCEAGPLWAMPLAQRAQLRTDGVAELYLANNGLRDADVALLCQGLRSVKQLRKLDLSDNTRLTWQGVAAVAQLVQVQANPALDCAHVLGGAGCLALQELHLDRVRVGDAGSQMIGEAMAANDVLEVLSLNNCRIGAAGAAALQNVAFANSTLKSLLLDDNRCDGAGTSPPLGGSCF